MGAVGEEGPAESCCRGKVESKLGPLHQLIFFCGARAGGRGKEPGVSGWGMGGGRGGGGCVVVAWRGSEGMVYLFRSA